MTLDTGSIKNIKLYHLENSKSFRILLLFEILKVDYELVEIKRLPNMWPPEWLKDIHPIGASPVLRLDIDGKTITFAESGAIIEFFSQRFGKDLLPDPANVEQTTQYLAWMHFAESTYMQMNLLQFAFSHLTQWVPFSEEEASKVYDPVRAKLIEPRVNKNLRYMETELKKNGPDYFVGNKLSGADLMLAYCVESGSIFLDQYPTLKAWRDNFHQQDFFKAAQKISPMDFSFFR